MASPAATTLLASRHERSHLNRVVVRAGAVAAWVATAIYLVAGAFTGETSLLIQAVGPLIASSIMTVQIVASREDGGLALFSSGIVVAVWYSLFGEAGTIVLASVALVLIGSLSMLFVTNHRRVIAGIVAAILFWLPFTWDLTTDEKVILGSMMALGFAMTHFVFSSIQTTTAAINTRFQMLFENSPTAALEEDWSEALDYVREEYTGKPDRIRQFLLAYPAVVKMAVAKSRVLRANEAALKLLEIRNPARFLGYRDPDIVTEDNMESVVSALVCLYEGGDNWESEFPVRRRSGEQMWLQNRSVDTSTGRPASSIVVALADVTHDRQRNDAMADLVRSKDEFIANVSHELRTPLTAIIGLTAEMMANNQMNNEERSELLGLVAGQADEMSNIVDDLLVAARAEMGTVSVEITTVDLQHELQATVEGIGMSVEFPPIAPDLVLADPRRVRQILRNLLTNAQRYGGPRRRIVTGSLTDRVWLEVRDNGPGIPEDKAPRIFEPYVTGDTAVHGSVGLGLAVARQLAELMGGTLDYERSAAETVFRLVLPIALVMKPILASHSDAV